MVKAVFDKDLTQADGFDWDTRYQMVPFQGRRGGFHVDSADEALEVTFEPPGIARFEARIFIPPGVSVSDFAIAVPPRTSLRFEMVGVKHGNATMVVRNPAGKPLAHLLVSVKKEIPKTYSICMLRDMVHLSPWSEQKLRPIMQRVHSCFLRQANIRLSERTNTIFRSMSVTGISAIPSFSTRSRFLEISRSPRSSNYGRLKMRSRPISLSTSHGP
jgi:hypothetical protein